MSGGQAETLLQAKGEPWTFLVRESLSQPGDFVLSVLSDQPKAGPGSPLKVTHIKVMCEVRQPGRGEGILLGLLSVLGARAAGRISLGFGPRPGGVGRETQVVRNGLTWHPSGWTLYGGWLRDL